MPPVAGLGVIRPETDAPREIERAGFSQMFGASSEKVLFHGRIMYDLSQRVRKDGVSPDAVLNSLAEITQVSTDTFVRT